MQELFRRLVAGERLDAREAEEAFGLVLGGHADDTQIGALLVLLQVRGVTLDELIGGARVMRRFVTRVPVDAATRVRLIDTCGTGGAPKTFNVSTAAALIAAAAERNGERIAVAKHGSRSRTGRGSSEVLVALGVDVDAAPEVQARCLEEIGVCFCFAIHHHPAMKHAAGPRRSLGIPTIFNLLGPLTNPAGAPRQLLGVYDGSKVELVARALVELGAESAMVVHGRDGLDEITTTDRTLVARVAGGEVAMEEIDPVALGFPPATLDDLRAEDLAGAAETIRGIVGGAAGPKTDIALLNAGAALVVGGLAGDIAEGVALAREAVATGRARRTLADLARLSRSPG